MGFRIVKLPDVGEGVAEAEVVEWHVAKGDHVVEDQVLAAVMTDKATVEIPSPVSGTVIECGRTNRNSPCGRRQTCDDRSGAGNRGDLGKRPLLR